MIDVNTLEPGDAFVVVCPNPKCQKLHLYVVIDKQGPELSIIWDEMPQKPFKATIRNGKLYSPKDNVLHVVSVVDGAGDALLEKNREYEALVADVLAHEYDDLGEELAMIKHAETLRACMVLASDTRLSRTTSVAYGLIKLAGTEPTAELVAMVSMILKTPVSGPTIAIVLQETQAHHFRSDN